MSTAFLDLLEACVPGRVDTDIAIRDERSHDRSAQPWARALAIVRVRDTAEVSAVLRIAHRHGVPVVPRGAGTGLEGGANPQPAHPGAPESDALVLDLSEMTRILEIDAASGHCRVQAGVRRSALNPVLAPHGQHFAAGPGVDATIGGMAATRASGTNAVRYGTMSENVLGLTAVLATGEIVTCGSLARKSAAGYDLSHLFIGSEGTLGVITELSVRTHAIAPACRLSVLSFPDVESAARTVQVALARNIPLARAELLDEVQISAMNAYSGTAFPETTTLFIEITGSEQEVAARAEEMSAVASGHGLVRETSIPGQDPEEFWRVRHDALPAAAALRPHSYTLSTDVCVPLSALAECISATKHELLASGLTAPIAGHVGDGNFHLAFVLEIGNDPERAAAEALYDRLIDRALAAGGTCTGEHGIGMGKIRELAREHPAGIAVMSAVKRALDPEGIMNPGKVLAV